MPKVLSPEEAVQRAQRVQEGRIDAIRALAEARQQAADVAEKAAQKLADVKTETDALLADAERADLRAYNAAVAAGWSADELRKVGFDEPEKKKRTARRARTTKAPAPASSTQPVQPEERREDAPA